MSLFRGKNKNSVRIVLFLLGLICAGVIVGRMVVDVRPLPQESEAPRTAVVQEEISLYFGDQDASGLLEERRMVPHAGDDFTALSQIVNELARGPEAAEMTAVIPVQTRLLGVRKIDASTLKLDFSRELAQYHPGGSSSELLSVHSLANSIAAYLPEFTQFEFWIEGSKVESLKGHVDLSRPVRLDPNWVRTDARTLAPAATQ